MKINIKLIAKVALAVAVVWLGVVIRSHSGTGEHIGWAIGGWALTGYVVLRLVLALRRGRAALKLQGPGPVSIKHIEKAAISAMPGTLALYVDEPARFVDAVNAASARQHPRVA